MSIEVFYNHINDEIKELRNERWKISIYFTSVPIGILALVKEKEMLGDYFDMFTCGGALLLVLSICFYVWLMYRNHIFLNNARNTRRGLESA